MRRGDVIVVRYADDTIVGFEHQHEAEQFLADLKDRLAQFGLSLHPEKTRLIEFGAVCRRTPTGTGRRQAGDGKVTMRTMRSSASFTQQPPSAPPTLQLTSPEAGAVAGRAMDSACFEWSFFGRRSFRYKLFSSGSLRCVVFAPEGTDIFFVVLHHGLHIGLIKVLAGQLFECRLSCLVFGAQILRKVNILFRG